MKLYVIFIFFLALFIAFDGCKKNDPNPVASVPQVLWSDTTVWTSTTLPSQAIFIEHLAVSGDTIFAATDGGVFRSTDNGTTWSAMNSGLTPTRVLAIAVEGSTVLAGGGGVHLSTNSGESWTSINTGISGHVHKLEVMSVALSNNVYLAGLAEDGVFCSTDKGATWTHSYSDTASALIVNGVTISGSTLYVGALSGLNDGKIKPGGVLISSDNGASWSPTGLFGNDIDVVTLAVHNETIFASGYVGVYRSMDNGKSWMQIISGYPWVEICPLICINDTLYAGTFMGAGSKEGLYASPNNGDNWFMIESGFPHEYVYTLAYNEKYIFATSGIDVIRRLR